MLDSLVTYVYNIFFRHLLIQSKLALVNFVICFILMNVHGQVMVFEIFVQFIQDYVFSRVRLSSIKFMSTYLIYDYFKIVSMRHNLQ